MPGRTKSISATKLSELAICQKMVALSQQHGEPAATPERQAKLDLGTVIHERTETAVHARQRPSPCFVATVVYGTGHPNTKTLRAYRDQVLRITPVGRALVAIYYRLSPALADWLGRNQSCIRPVRWVLDRIVSCVRGRIA